MWRGVSLLILLAALAGCAAQSPAPLPGLASMVPAESFDRTDLPCYYGPVW